MEVGQHARKGFIFPVENRVYRNVCCEEDLEWPGPVSNEDGSALAQGYFNLFLFCFYFKFDDMSLSKHRQRKKHPSCNSLISL